MDIKVGEYVRLARNQGINKIIDIKDGFFILDIDIADEWGDETWRIEHNKIDEEILNHSEEPIDLIEVGDYVNGEKILSISPKRDYLYAERIGFEEKDNQYDKHVVHS